MSIELLNVETIVRSRGALIRIASGSLQVWTDAKTMEAIIQGTIQDLRMLGSEVSSAIAHLENEAKPHD